MANFTPMGVMLQVRGLSAFGRDMQGVGRSVTNLGCIFGTLGKTVVGAGVIIGAAFAGMAVVGGIAAGKMVGVAANYETAFTGVTKTVDGLSDEFNNLTDAGIEVQTQLRNISKTKPFDFSYVAEAAQVAGQLGVPYEQLDEFTQVAVDLAASTDLTAAAAVEGLARISTIFGKTGDDMTQNVANLGAGMIDLGNQIAATEDEIMTYTMRMAGAGRMAGLTQQDLLGIGAAVAASGVYAEAGGTAMQRMFIAIDKAVNTSTGEFLDNTEEIKKNSESLTNLTGKLMKYEQEAGMTGDEMLALYDQFIATGGSAEDFGRTLGATEMRNLWNTANDIRNLSDETEWLRQTQGQLVSDDLLGTFAKASGTSVEEFRKLWEEDASGAIIKFVNGVADAGSEAYDILDTVGLGNERSLRAILSLSGAEGELARAVGIANNAWDESVKTQGEDTALTREANKRYSTLASQVQILGNRFKDIAFVLGNAMMPIVKGVIARLMPTFDWLDQKVPSIAEKIGKMGEKFSILLTMFDKFGVGGALKYLGIDPKTADNVEIIVERIKTKMGEVFSYIQGLVGSFSTGGVGGLMAYLGFSDDAIAKVETAINDIKGWISGLLESIATRGTKSGILSYIFGEGVFETLRDIQGRIAQTIADLTPIVNDIIATFNVAWETFISTIKPAIDDMLVAIGNLSQDGSGTIDWLKVLGDVFHYIGIAIGFTLVPLVQVITFIANIVTAIADFIAAIKDADNAFDVLLAIGNLVLGFGNAIADSIMAIATFAGDFITRMFASQIASIDAWLATASSNINTWLNTAVSNISAWLATAGANIENWVKTAITNISDWITTAWTNIGNWIKTAGDNIQTTVSTSWNNIKSDVTSAVQTLYSQLLNTWENIKSGVIEKVNTLWATLSTTFSEIVQSILDYFVIDDFLIIGLNVIDGIIQGLKDRLEELKNTVSGIAGDVKQWFMDAFGAHSPAREMIPIGVAIIQGIEVGMSNEKQKLTSEGIDVFHDTFKAWFVFVRDSMGASGGNMRKQFTDVIDGLLKNFQVTAGETYGEAAKRLADITQGILQNISGGASNFFAPWFKSIPSFFGELANQAVVEAESIYSRLDTLLSTGSKLGSIGSGFASRFTETIIDPISEHIDTLGEKTKGLESSNNDVGDSIEDLVKQYDDAGKKIEKLHEEEADDLAKLAELEFKGKRESEWDKLQRLEREKERNAEIADLQSLQVSLDAQRVKLLEEQEAIGAKIAKTQAETAELEAQRAKEQAKITELEQKQSDIAFLQQQMELLKLIEDNGLNAQNILGGMKLGLDADLTQLLTAMTSAMGEVIKAAEKELGVASPSKKFAEIMHNVVLGAEKGWTSSMPRMLSSITGSLDTIIAATTGALGAVVAAAPSVSGGNVTNNTYNLTAQYANAESESSLMSDLWAVQQMSIDL